MSVANALAYYVAELIRFIIRVPGLFFFYPAPPMKEKTVQQINMFVGLKKPNFGIDIKCLDRERVCIKPCGDQPTSVVGLF
jgi:hypothetical protein